MYKTKTHDEYKFISDRVNMKSFDASSMEYMNQNPDKSVYYHNMDVIGVKEGDEVIVAIYSKNERLGMIRKLAFEYKFGDTREVSTPSRVPCDLMMEISKDDWRFTNTAIAGCYRTADIVNFKQARMIDNPNGMNPIAYAKDQLYRYVLVPNRSKNVFYVMNETSSVPTNEQICAIVNVFPQSMDDVILYDLFDRAIQMTESSIPPFVKSNAMSPEARMLSPRLVIDNGLYIFKITVPSSTLKRKFCPDINYKEFDNAGCSSRLSKDACRRSLTMNYVAEENLCSTPYDYKSNDPFKNYNDFTLLSQMLLKDYQLPFRSSVRGSHPPETFGKQMELLLKTAMTVATATGYVVSADSMDAETRLPLINSPSYFGIIHNALNHINNPMTQPSPLTDQFQDHYKSVLMKLRSFRDADEFNRQVVVSSDTSRPRIGGLSEEESGGISTGARIG